MFEHRPGLDGHGGDVEVGGTNGGRGRVCRAAGDRGRRHGPLCGVRPSAGGRLDLVRGGGGR